MKHLLKSAALAAIMGVTGSAAFAQEVTLRCQHFLSPKASVPQYFMEPWAEKVMADSGGRIKVELYPAMQLGGKPPALYDQIRDGVIDCGWALPAYTPGRFPESEVFELPFMTSMSAEDSSKAVWEYSQKYLTERMGDIHLMATHLHGPGVIHKKGDPIMKPSDLAGVKLRGPSRQANKLLETLGATPVGIPVPAFPEALSKGVVDGGVIPWEIVPPLKVHELADSHTQIGGDRALYNTFFVWGMNKAVYDGLPDDLKAVIDANSGIEVSAAAGRAMDTGDKTGLEVTQGTDNKVVTLDDASVAELKVIGEELTAAWIAEMTEKGLDGAAMVKDAQELVAKHAN
ncbi:TRAP-type C4-dicarboxylate transport system substrate-binding protein [Litoreibacter ponti]|uniref:TRAP-type C4-dicarboxylate transport system substrate-binding protein n=1 Tax=Litoreibacter ponti TaxID=1510457 RepID=A0A2T6BIE4_9RHOB|nr:TRAP transporter substrate-binding protein [Litoreibacter ponti]PTX55825.1 TRAP-type C4-dicarboxylate transport system substrate-binding protein [Litoreibacter ponti]